MGQRTQVLVLKENNKGERKAYFFHHQWGFGRNMYLNLIDMVIGDYCKETFHRGYNFLANPLGATKNAFYDVTEDIPNNVLEAVDPDNLQTITDVFSYGDNNNGGMFVYIKENEQEYHNASFKVGFLLGDEDEGRHREYDDGTSFVNGKAWERWLTPAEYGKMNGGNCYSDSAFIKMFNAFCEYFGVEVYGQETTENENDAE